MSNWTFNEDEDKVYKYSKTNSGQKKQPYKFKAKMYFEGTRRGRSSVTFWFTDQDGKRYPMFVSDFTDLLKEVTITKGVLPEMEYTQAKKGQSIGIRITKQQLDNLKN